MEVCRLYHDFFLGSVRSKSLSVLNPVFCRYQAPDIDVQLSSELSGSLRTLKVLATRVAACYGDPVLSDDNHPCSPCPLGLWATTWLPWAGPVGPLPGD